MKFFIILKNICKNNRKLFENKIEYYVKGEKNKCLDKILKKINLCKCKKRIMIIFYFKKEFFFCVKIY